MHQNIEQSERERAGWKRKGREASREGAEGKGKYGRGRPLIERVSSGKAGHR